MPLGPSNELLGYYRPSLTGRTATATATTTTTPADAWGFNNNYDNNGAA